MRFAAFACCAVLALPLPVEAGCVDGDTRTCAMGGGCPGESECVGGRWTPCLCTVQFDGQEAGPCSIRATPLDGAGCVAQYGGGTLKCTTRCAGTCDIDTSPGSLQWQSTTMLPNDGLRAFEAVECGGGPGTCPFTDSQNSTTYNFEHGRSKSTEFTPAPFIEPGCADPSATAGCRFKAVIDPKGLVDLAITLNGSTDFANGGARNELSELKEDCASYSQYPGLIL